jgi:hypothetical protein
VRLKKVAPAVGSNPESTFATYRVGTRRSNQMRVAMTSSERSSMSARKSAWGGEAASNLLGTTRVVGLRERSLVRAVFFSLGSGAQRNMTRTALASRYWWTRFRKRWSPVGDGAKPRRAGEPFSPTQTRPSPPPAALSCTGPTRGSYAAATAASRARLALPCTERVLPASLATVSVAASNCVWVRLRSDLCSSLGLMSYKF